VGLVGYALVRWRGREVWQNGVSRVLHNRRYRAKVLGMVSGLLAAPGGRGKETRERILDSCGTEIENRYGDLKKCKREFFDEVMWEITFFVFNFCEIFKAVGEREGGIRSNV